MSPAVAYRLAGWRSRGPLGQGRLVLVESRRGRAQLRYASPVENDHLGCPERQDWVLGIVRRGGGSRATLREGDCLLRGGTACDYTVVWADAVRPARAVIAGLLVAPVVAFFPVGMSSFGWTLVPAAVATAYALERWRAADSRRVADGEAGRALRQVLAGRDTSPFAEEGSPSPDEPVLEQAGEFWRVSYAGTSVMLRHSRGFVLLAHLIRHPGRAIHVRELDAITPSGGSPVAREALAPEDGLTAGTGDADEVLDGRAKTEYRRRLEELRAELENAEGHNDLGRAERVRAEIDVLLDQLRAAGGRLRRASPDVERLRGAITRRIRTSITQIARHHPALGAHLSANVSTGYFCGYAVGGIAEPTPTDRAR
jgi:hypothetical protein